MRERRAAVTDEQVQQVLAGGVERAKAISNATMKRVRDAIGMTL
jgi:hypothetical protein